MQNKILYLLSLLVFVFVSCKSKKDALQNTPVVNETKPAPIWVSSRPNNGFKYIGIGFADKAKGDNYQMEAKKNALYDLVSEIKVDINSNSVLYTVQNNSSFNESFNSMIKLSNNENIEGYQQIDSYENDKQYWIYYSLDKEEYAKKKAEKKQQTISKAASLINSSFTDEKNNDFSSSLKKRIQAFGVLTPYLSEEITFDANQSGGVKTVFDLTGLIQKQLQTITVLQPKVLTQLLPFQINYAPLNYTLQINGKTPLYNFPISIKSEEDKLKIIEKSTTNSNGEMQVKINSIEPLNQVVVFSLSPDINGLMGTDSVSKSAIKVLSQFINTQSLKVNASVRPIQLYLNCIENNFGKPTNNEVIKGFIEQKLSSNETIIVSNKKEADFIIEAISDTKKDISSETLKSNYQVELAELNIKLQLINPKDNQVLYNNQANEVYGYANNLDQAGLNAYTSDKLKAKLFEALFFLKRKIIRM